jgi:DNA helicase TIP49 (TBP-interacting protein)
MSSRSQKVPMNFNTMAQVDVPQGRNGKHKQIVTKILSDLDQLKEGAALKVPLDQLSESKEKVRAALNRATHKSDRNVATATDADYLYVWNQKRKEDV